jgi:CheY-like chemotaxis protein
VFWFTIPYRPDQLSADVVHAEIKKRSAAANEVDSEGDSCHHSLLPFRITTTCLDVHTIGSLPPQCVLVVDDAPLIVKMTTVLLSRKGHTVESAVNGADALEKLLQGYERAHSAVEPPEGARIDTAEYSTPYDVVLMDLQMPVLDGIEAIRRLRAAERGWQGGQGAQEAGEQANPSALRSSHQMVIALSANSDEETRLAALEAGADAFMAKPFTYENFLEVMRHRQEK